MTNEPKLYSFYVAEDASGYHVEEQEDPLFGKWIKQDDYERMLDELMTEIAQLKRAAASHK